MHIVEPTCSDLFERCIIMYVLSLQASSSEAHEFREPGSHQQPRCERDKGPREPTGEDSGTVNNKLEPEQSC